MRRHPTPRPRGARGARTLFLALAAVLAAVGTARAQERIVVLTESGTPMIATEVLLAVGPLEEPPEHAGITHLAARALTRPIQASLAEMGARLTVQPYKDAVGFTLIAAPDAWEEASRTLLVALFRDPVDSVAVERERAAILAELAGRADNPADALATEVDRAFWGEEHPWGRPAVGTPDAVRRIRYSLVDGFLREHFLQNRVYVAVVGPIARETATRHLATLIGGGSPARPPAQAGLPAEIVARREYNSITTWISSSFRFGQGADLEALRLLTHLAEEGISFGPRRPSIYNSRSEIFPRHGEGEIRFQIVVPPTQADEWAERMENVIAEFARRPLQREDFEQRIRSYRGSRLLALSSPEDRARELARQVFLTGSTSPLIDFEQLTPARLHAAARALEAPIVLLLGPTIRSE